MPEFFATCSKGLEGLLLGELRAMEVENPDQTAAGVGFTGTLAKALEVCLKTRYASKVLYVLKSYACESDDELYGGVYSVPWEQYFTERDSISVDFNGTGGWMRNSQFGAMRVKDAVCDHFVSFTRLRPDVNKFAPDVKIVANLVRHQVNICLDLSGTLQIPNFNMEQFRMIANLRGNLAYAILERSGYTPEYDLFDPMCGFGTLLIRAAMIATDTAPGLACGSFGFSRLRIFDDGLKEHWEGLVTEARSKAEQGRERALRDHVRFVGFQGYEEFATLARTNVERFGFGDLVRIDLCEIEDLYNPLERRSHGRPSMIVTNPPYGVRMGDFNEMVYLYSKLGEKFKSEFAGSRAAVISSSPELLSCLKLKADKNYSLYNGQLACQLRIFEINKDAAEHSYPIEEFKNRLAKNVHKMPRFARMADTDAYRVYDMDLPQYRLSLDCYGGKYVAYDYSPPKRFDERKAQNHLLDMIAAIIEVTGCMGTDLVVKHRSVQSGDSQYEAAREKTGTFMTVHEMDMRYLVNLTDYIDTGLFLDARPIRALIRTLARDREFLNLFSYTSTASVAAAKGGAKRIVNVDMSKTYLEWGIANFMENNLDYRQHRFLQQDCMYFLSYGDAGTFDLVYLDPPTFSNSKRMEGTLDIVRDHVRVLACLTRHLKDGATVLFCSNKRGFKINAEALAGYGYAVRDLTEETIPRDFANHKGNIHTLFELTFSKDRCTGSIEPLCPERGPARWSKEITASHTLRKPGDREGRREVREDRRKELRPKARKGPKSKYFAGKEGEGAGIVRVFGPQGVRVTTEKKKKGGGR